MDQFLGRISFLIHHTTRETILFYEISLNVGSCKEEEIEI